MSAETEREVVGRTAGNSVMRSRARSGEKRAERSKAVIAIVQKTHELQHGRQK